MNTRFKKTAEVRLHVGLVNLVALPLTVLLVAACLWLVANLPHTLLTGGGELLPTIPALAVLIILHELTHGLFFVRLTGTEWSALKFGFMPLKFMFYCHYALPVPVKTYRLVTLGPLLLLGPISLAALFAFPTIWLAIATGMHLAGCIGDVWIFTKLKRFDANLWVMDHPSEPGCDVFELAVDPTVASQYEISPAKA